MTTSLVIAKAPITPSNEKDASNTSRYKKPAKPLRLTVSTAAAPSSSFSKKTSKLLTAIYKTTPPKPATKTVRRVSLSIGKNSCNKKSVTKAIKMLITSSLPKALIFSSKAPSQWTSLSLSNIKLRKTSSKNIPPKAAIPAWLSIRCREYSCGSFSAILMTSSVPKPVAMATMTIGNTKRIPNTAIKIPMVKKICCHFSSISLRIEALTTALSNDKLTSIIPNTNTKKTAVNTPIGEESPHQTARPTHKIVTRIEYLKSFHIMKGNYHKHI